jgi:glycosyltransferase involved in cell wall biosynthesis
MSFLKIALLTTDKREHDRDYQNPCPSFGTAPQGLLSGFANLQDLEVHVISCTQQPMSSPAKLANNIWFHSLHVPKIGWLRTGYAGCILAVRKKLKEIQPDIVHGQGTERDCAISAMASPYPKILTIHGNLRLIKKTIGFRPFSALWLQSLSEGFVVPRFDGVICITRYTQQALAQEAQKTWIVPNAVDPIFLALGEERLGGSENSIVSSAVLSDGLHGADPTSLPSAPSNRVPVILVVANIDPRKNQNSFIRTLDPLATEHRFNLKFFGQCGEDDYGKEFQSLVAHRSWCSFGGMIGRHELRQEFAMASLLALPTLEDNCPMVVLEAQAAGIPVMASKVGGVPDLIEDGVTGLLTDPARPDSMRHAISRLLSDSNLSTALASNARLQSIKRFHPNVIAQRHLEIYREVFSCNKVS